MASQEQSRPQRREGDPDTPAPVTPPGAAQTTVSDADIDSVLDEIDDVLEINAEEFVRSFVQKGGQ
ncbi:MAG: ubiquitin-like protein Pup [Candidatus Phosphoribacter sp.]|nr:ubiquitin-like protein Pup [Actinomycetales bacterium]